MALTHQPFHTPTCRAMGPAQPPSHVSAAQLTIGTPEYLAVFRADMVDCMLGGSKWHAFVAQLKKKRELQLDLQELGGEVATLAEGSPFHEKLLWLELPRGQVVWKSKVRGLGRAGSRAATADSAEGGCSRRINLNWALVWKAMHVSAGVKNRRVGFA